MRSGLDTRLRLRCGLGDIGSSPPERTGFLPGMASLGRARNRVGSLFWTLLGHSRRSPLTLLRYFPQWFPASWDARRLASAWHATLWRAQWVFRRTPERFSALRPPSFGVSEAKVASLGRRRVARTRWAV